MVALAVGMPPQTMSATGRCSAIRAALPAPVLGRAEQPGPKMPGAVVEVPVGPGEGEPVRA